MNLTNFTPDRISQPESAFIVPVESGSNLQISSILSAPPPSFSFHIEGEEVIRISQGKFYFKGAEINDSHYIYEIFTDWTYKAQGMPSPVKIPWPEPLPGKSRYKIHLEKINGELASTD